MALVAYFNLEMHQIDVKTAFGSGQLFQEIYMSQPECLDVEGKKCCACN